MAVSASARRASNRRCRRAFLGTGNTCSIRRSSPARRSWTRSGALIGASGELLGIGSLIVPDAGAPGADRPAMFVPVDVLKPILGPDRQGSAQRPGAAVAWPECRRGARPPLCRPGLARRSGRARRAISGDILLAVGNEEVSTLADFYSFGAGARQAPRCRSKVLKGARVAEVKVRSMTGWSTFGRRRPTS